MTTSSRHGLFKQRGLTQTELAEIQRLADLCNSFGGLDLKLNWSSLQERPPTELNDFLYYENGTLIGYLALFSFNSREGEISGMVDPAHRRKGIFTTLFKAAREECQRRKLPTLLFIVERASQSGKAFVESLGVQYHHSEYKMVLEEPRMPSAFDERLHFRRAVSEDAPLMAHITARSFDMEEGEIDWYVEHVMDRSSRRCYVAFLDEAPVGKLDVAFEGDEVAIYGFGVLPEYRRKGYGRQILARTIQEIRASGQWRVWLEVATENEQALSLYQSCGFKVTSSYDYYRLDTHTV